MRVLSSSPLSSRGVFEDFSAPHPPSSRGVFDEAISRVSEKSEGAIRWQLQNSTFDIRIIFPRTGQITSGLARPFPQLCTKQTGAC